MYEFMKDIHSISYQVNLYIASTVPMLGLLA